MRRKIIGTLLGCALMLICCLGLNVKADEGETTASAKIIGHSLTILDGEIAVNFCVDIDGMDDADTVKVTMNGDTETATISELKTNDVIIDAKSYKCYVFTQKMSAKRMGDDISFCLTEADGKVLVRDNYCVNDYMTEVKDAGYGLNMENLTESMTYYGQFAEVYLNYNGATNAEQTAIDSIADVDVSDLEDYAMKKSENWPEGLTFYGAQLNLVSKTTLRLCFTVADDKVASFGEFKAVSGECAISLGTLQRGGYGTSEYYYVDMEGFGAHELGEAYSIYCGEQLIIENCSPLSYAYSVLKTYSENSDKVALVNLSKALYQYNQKAVTYVNAPTTGVYDLYYNGSGFYAEPGCTNEVYLTSDGEVTTAATGNDEITTLSQLNSSRTRGCSVWMMQAYTISDSESLTGPYVIRRYSGNIGNVLNVTGTATIQVKVDGSLVTDEMSYVARYAEGTQEVSFAEAEATVSGECSMVRVNADAIFTVGKDGIIQNSHVKNGEVYVSGKPVAFKVTENAKTGVITVDTDATDVDIDATGLTIEAEIVLANHDRQSLTGNGEVSAVSLIDDGMNHFDVVKQDNNLRIASVICVCGDDVSGEASHACQWTTDIANVYGVPWEPLTGTKLPETSGAYYLTQNFTQSSRTRIESTTANVNLDLNGYTVTKETATSNNYLIHLGNANSTYTISDSSLGQTGVLDFDSDYTSSSYGDLLNVVNGQMDIYGGRFDMSKVKAAYRSPITVSSNGKLYIHGGVFIPASGKEEDAISNCIEKLGALSIDGGCIYGEVVKNKNNTDGIVISGSPIVGAREKTSDTYDYGIGVSNSAYPLAITYSNIGSEAKIVIKTLANNVTVSETISDSSKVSGFEILDIGKDGHYGYVRKSTGTVELATKICVCGAVISDEYNHRCEWVDGETHTIDEIYSLNWQECKTEYYLPTSAGAYYLTGDMALTNRANVTQGNTIHLDLNGYKATMNTNSAGASSDKNCVFRIANENAKYTIADSSREQTGSIQLSSTYTTTCQGSLVNYTQAGSMELYSGTIDMGNLKEATVRMIDVSKGSFNVYGGVIKPVASVKSGTTECSNCIYARGTGTVTATGGMIYGEVVLATAENTLTVKDDAKIGLPWPAESTTYGIDAWEEGTQINCYNITEQAQVIFGSTDSLTLNGTDGNEYEIVKKDDYFTLQKK